MTTTLLGSIDVNGIVMRQSFTSDVMGIGQSPSGTKMGFGTIHIDADNKGHGKWHEMMVTN